VEPAAEAE